MKINVIEVFLIVVKFYGFENFFLDYEIENYFLGE